MPTNADPHRIVILVEEQTHERLYIAQHLAENGFGVLQAEDSDAALTLLESSDRVDALVSDAHVPGQIDGFELARLARDRWPDIAVVMMSGHSDASSGPLPAGSEFVAKPYLTDRLVPALNSLFKGRL